MRVFEVNGYESDSESSLGTHLSYEEQPQEDLDTCADNILGKHTDPAYQIRSILLRNQELVSINSTKHIYINEDMGWMPLQADVSARKICDILGTNAPVNYVKATRPIVDALVSCEAPPFIYGPTFSQGRIRCSFAPTSRYSDGSTKRLSLGVAVPLNMSEEDLDRNLLYTAKESKCKCPLKFKRMLKSVAIPRSLNLPGKSYLCSWIYDVFEENTETIMWIIGDILADFGNKRMFMLYGPANIGKTTVINIIESLASAKVPKIEPRYFAKDVSAKRNYGNSLTEQTIGLFASTRLVTVGDLEITDESEHINMQTVKEITGGDQGSSGIVSVTILVSVNRLFNYEFMEEYTASDRTRRVNVVPTVLQRANKRDLMLRDTTSEEKSELIAMAIATRYKYDKPPLTTMAVLMTLFQAKFKYALSIVCIDEEASLMENYAATRVLCYKFNISEYDMADCLRTIGTKCIKLFLNVPVIANVCLKHRSKVYREKSRAEYERYKKQKKYGSSKSTSKGSRSQRLEQDFSDLL